MTRRHYLPFLLVLGSVALFGEAEANMQIPATAGAPGNSTYVNFPGSTPLTPAVPPQYWTWANDVYVRRASDSTAPFFLEWIIPLVFYQPSGGMKAWTARVYVSNGTRCNLQWRPDDVPVAPSPLMGTQYTIKSGDGALDLATSTTCPLMGPVAGCVTAYASAYVSCFVPQGGFVGPVSYTISAVP